MNDNAKQWVAALRSGEYEQGIKCLRDDDDKFCCLGVGCETYHKSTGQLPAEFDDNYHDYIYGDECASLPNEVRDWLGMSSSSGGFGSLGRTLMGLNDSGSTFEEIADLIESEPEGLFV